MTMNSDQLRQLLSYDQCTGEFRRLKAGPNAPIGAIAGCIDSRGYWIVKISGSRYRAHRLAWLYVHGCWPKNEIDHIDGNRSNNKLANLREANHAENCQNLAINPRNTSGHPGVSWDKQYGKWRAHIRTGGIYKSLGRFADKADAVSARNEAKSNLHKFNPFDRAAGIARCDGDAS